MEPTPRLFVIRGGQSGDRSRRPTKTASRSSEERAEEHSAEDASVISLHEGWLRVLERQARSIKP